VRRALGLLVAAGIVLGTAGQAAPPEPPVTFISVDQLKRALDRGGRPEIIDVRSPEAYAEMHIAGARSIPLRAIPGEARRISKTGLVVFY
jgi:rhodanese-related sulfurtransferase